ncbi:OmpA family protein [Sediminibacterium roseum]|uniref:OmpA family protein n=1 Tax=Sediminibacterium roseum TaxID=1978412 RepID=A0ABW9ZQZ3_9BACT|nr:OmpA family protein [Sediminibacterium roseum]NCI48709.1 OmpA family protein [Sediminibacterium roseum]
MTRLLLSLLLLPCIKAHAQNLIANPGFEDRNTCTELHKVCAPEGWFRIPLDAVSANKGTAGFLIGNHHDNIVMENVKRPGIGRTYLYTKLLCSLEKGKEYRFTAFFRTGGNDDFHHMNLLWTNFEPFRFQGRILSEKSRYTIKPADKTNDQPVGWKEYELRFVATGEEKYVLIGNLERDVFPGKGSQQRGLIIYEIDNVSLRSVDGNTGACAEISVNKEKLYLNNYRHTPGKFIDEEEEVVSTPTPKDETKTDTPVPAPIVVAPPPVVNDTLVIPDVLFKFDKKDLNPAFAYRLDTLIDKIKNKTFKRIEILGHTDSLGNNTYNQKLSISRAETVKKYLIDRLNYPADIIITKGFAATLPVSTNATGEGRQKNRRVEIVLIK